MKVGKLIEKLQELDKDKEVGVWDTDDTVILNFKVDLMLLSDFSDKVDYVLE